MNRTPIAAFVTRGLVQWCHFWEHNHWQTAYDRDVKYVKQWQQAFRDAKTNMLNLNGLKDIQGIWNKTSVISWQKNYPHGNSQ